MSNRYSIGFATVVMLVVLRLNIGWHFFSEGVSHYTDHRWSSEGFLRAAKGPLAPLYRSYLPDFHHFEELLHAPAVENEEHAVQGWVDEIQKDWDEERQRFAQRFNFDEAQVKLTMKVLSDHAAELRDWAAANREALHTHVHEWQRKETTRTAPAGDLPFQKKRVTDKQGALAAEANGWKAELEKIERGFHEDLAAMVDTPEARQSLANRNASLQAVDGVMKYAITGIGLLLIVGLFTRLAALAGAAFLLSVVLTQPFWVSEAAPTFNQFVEMFALLTLATTQVGRWAGLDHFLPGGRTGDTKGKTDVSQS